MSKVAYFNYRAALLNFIENECFIQHYYRENTNYINGKKYLAKSATVSIIGEWDTKDLPKEDWKQCSDDTNLSLWLNIQQKAEML